MQDPLVEAVPRHPTLAEAAAVWARIGLLSFGGPAGQIALMHKELVEERRWISESRCMHALNFCMLLPGPEAQQLATYIGWLLHGTKGGIIAGTLFVLPGLLVILGLSALYAVFQDTDWLASLFFGLKAAVLAIVIDALIRVGRRALKNVVMVGLAAIAFVALFAFNVPFPVVVLLAGFAGYVGTRIDPSIFAASGHKASLPDRPSVIDDAFLEQRPTLAQTAISIAAWLALWALPLLLIVPALGWTSTLAALWLFFSQMAVVTFGGAYAVLAYVAQEAVQNYGWLHPGEMVDGLALAETTPGPLVLVLSFVGFLAAFRDPAGLDPMLAGIVGGVLTTWVTFVPCFLWIFWRRPLHRAAAIKQGSVGGTQRHHGRRGGRHRQPRHLVRIACPVCRGRHDQRRTDQHRQSPMGINQLVGTRPEWRRHALPVPTEVGRTQDPGSLRCPRRRHHAGSAQLARSWP